MSDQFIDNDIYEWNGDDADQDILDWVLAVGLAGRQDDISDTHGCLSRCRIW